MTITVGKERIVPWVSSWTGEEEFWLGELHGSPAIMQKEAQGLGEPQFDFPHIMRQRKALSECLCGVCGKPMKGHTKIMLGEPHEVEVVYQNIPAFIQPFSHRKCALQMIDNFPEIIGKLLTQEMVIVQAFEHQLIGELLSPEGTQKLIGKEHKGAVGHLKMDINKGTLRDMDWLKLIGYN